MQALDSFTNKAYSKRYGRSKDVCKPKLQNAYTIGVYVKCGSKRVLLASLSGQKGADSEIFQIYDMAPVLDPENIDKVGYINTLVFNPVFDYKYVLSPTDRAVVNLFLKFITNQLYAKLLECFTSDRVKAIYLITISKVLDFLSASGIVFERVPGVHLLQNEYTNYIFNSFQKYWQPELAKNTPQVLSFKGVRESMVQQNGEGRLEYDKETGQLWICS
ncbi:MAG: hypothetical protein IT262_05085 [Saprospiraceae bacterium]|nr:hypothetical protein [Saprospiraceae bacterium]